MGAPRLSPGARVRLQHLPRFDWNRACELRAAGLSYAAVALGLGVSPSAVCRVADPDRLARSRGRVRKWACPRCGGPKTANRGVKLCAACSRRARATSVRPSTLRCSSCRRWLPDDAYTKASREYELRRGRRYECRSCDTVLRQRSRQRRRARTGGDER